MLACVLFVQASAQTAASNEKQAAIKELVAIMNGAQNAEEMTQMITAQMEESRITTIKTMLDDRADLTAQEKAAIESSIAADSKSAFKRFQDKLAQKLDYNTLIVEIVSVSYDKHYTLAEIKDLLAFYKSPTGQKTVKLMPVIAQETMQQVQIRLMPKLPIIIRELMDEDRRELEQKINAGKPKPKN
jgi:hypothetical protein